MPNLTPSPDLVQSLDMAEVAATRPSARGTRPVGRGAARPEEAPAAPAPPSPARRASDEAEAAQWAKVRAAVETLPDFRATAPGREADDRGEFRKGAEGALSSLVSGIRLLASQDDDAEFTEALIDYQVEAERNAPKVGSYTEIDDGSSFGDYVAYNLGQGGASILTSIAGGGLGGAAVKAGVKKLAAGVVEKYVAKGYAKDVAETLAKKAIARTVARAGAAGQYAGAGVASSPMLLTETISGMAENGDVDMGAAALAVAAKATLDALPVFNIMRRAGVPDTLTREIKEKAASRFMKAAGDGLKDLTLEGMTEGAQSYIDQIAVESVANGELTLPAPDAEEVINSFLAGAIGAGGPSLASSAVGAARSVSRPTSVHVLAAQHPDVPHFKKASEIANKAVQAYQKGNNIEGASLVAQAEQLKAEGEKAVRRAQFVEKEATKREAQAPQAQAPQAQAPQAQAPQAQAPQAQAPQVGPARPTTRDIVQPNGPMPRVWRSPSSGKPFRNEKVAEAYRKAARLGPQTEVQPAVGGGFEVVSIEPRVWRSPTTGEPFRTERAARAHRDVTLGDVPGLAVRKTGGGFEVAPAGAAPTTPADAAPVAPADAAPTAPATSEPVFTLNKAGKPYRTKEAAQVAINMGREGLGENAKVVPYAGGFAILSDPKLAPAEAVEVKPAVRRERALNAKGNPYTTERAARAALGFRKAGVGANPAVVPVDGGYAIEYDAPEAAAPVDTAPPLRTVRKVRASGKGYASEKSAANAAEARKDIPSDHRIVPYEDGGFAIEYDEPGEAAPAKPADAPKADAPKADAPKADAPAAVDEKTGKARVDEVARSMVSRLNKQGSRLRLATKAPSDPESRAAESLAEVFGLHLRWVSNAPGKRRQIVSGAISGNVMLLNKQSSWPARAVVGHELVHRMRRQAPDLYSEVNAALTESLRRVQFDARGLERGMADVYRMKVGSDSLREEVVADLFGAEFTNPALYDLIAPNDPGLVAKVLRFIRDVLIQIKEEIGAFRGGRLSDVPQMDDWTKVVADTLKKYEKRVAVAKDNGGMKTQVTWHGSPHKWDRPDISKVGTGEGAQAYGYGFYSAEAEGVAEGYKKDLSGFEEPAIQTPSSIKSGSELDDTDLSVIRYLEFGQKDAGQFPHNTVYYAKKRAEAEGDSQALARLDEYGREARVVRRKNTGHLYKLDIPDEDIAKYLDWDKPLNEQSEAIQRAAVDIERAYWSAPAASKTVSMDEAFGGMSESDWLRSMSGEDLVEYLGDLLDDADVAGSRAHAVTKAAGLSGDVYANIAASGVLNAHGVPGIKYLDGTSRSTGEGTRNYVTFDPSRIKVLDRNGEQVGTADEFPELDSRQQAADAGKGDARIQFSLEEAGEQRQLRAARTLGIVEEDVRQGPDPKFSAQDAEAETAAWWKRYGGEKPRAAAWERVKKVMRRWATKEGLGNDWTFQRNVQREAGIRAGRQWYHVLATKLQDTVAAEYPAGAPADLSGRISDALHGRGPSDLPRPVMQVIKELRAHLDKMSTQFAGQLDENVYAFTRQAVDAYSRGDKTAMDAAFLAAAESENLAKIIRSNRGEYLHRSYQMFDDAGYAPTDEVRSAAVAAIAERTLALRAELQKRIDAGTATDLQKNRVAHIDEIGADTLAEATVREILAYGRGAADSSSGDFASMLMGKVGSMNVDALKQRDDSILPEVRALMGEYTDPVVNYQRTADNLVRLTENNAFLIALREQGLASGWFSEFSGENPEHDEKVAPGGSKVYRPLAGLYTSHDMNVALSDVMDDTYAGGWARAMIATAGTVKLFKTVANPSTHFHNFASSGLIAAFNGHFSPKRVIAAGKLYRAYIHDRGDLTKLVNEMLELGVFGSAADASELQKMLEDFGRSSHQWARDAHAGKSIQLARSIWDWTKRHYMGEDDFWKFVGFQAEFERISKREGVSEAEAKKLAAERIQNLYPNYDFVPKWVRALRRFPITSTFISFPYEMARTYINQYRYLEEDFKAGRMNEVYPRVAGLLTSASFAWAIAVTSRAIFGVDDDEEESIYEMAPEWQRNSNFLFLGRDENGNPTAIDLSYLDPMASWRRPIVALYRQAVRGGEVADVAAESAWEVFRTFGDWDMTFRAFVNAISGVDENGAPIYAKQADPGDKVVSAVAYMSDKLKPGVLDTGWRFWKAANEEVSSSGKQYTIGDESLALFGVRTTTFDPKVSLFYRAYEFADAKRAAAGALTSVARNPNRVSDDALRSALQQSLDYRRDTYEKMARLIRAARSGGMTAGQIRAVLKAQRISDDDVNYLLKGEMAPWKPKTSVLRSAIKKAEVLFGEEVAKEFQRRDLFLTREMAGVQ